MYEQTVRGLVGRGPSRREGEREERKNGGRGDGMK